MRVARCFCRLWRRQVHGCNYLGHHLRAASDAAIKEDVEDFLSRVVGNAAPTDLVAFLVSWHHATALQFLPLIRMTLLMGLQRTGSPQRPGPAYCRSRGFPRKEK